MLYDVRTRLTEAVVTGPGRAALFYGRHSMGEGLMADKARDATFLLTGAGMWVGKSAYLTTSPMTIQEGWWAIAQAVTDCWVRVRGLGCPHVNPLDQQTFRFDHMRGSPIKDTPGDGGSGHQPSPCLPSGGQDCNRWWRDQRPPSPLFPSHPDIVGSRVTGAYYQWLPWCHLGLIGQMDPDIPNGGDGTKRAELKWR